MEKQPNTFESLFENAGDYLETRLDLFKLKAIDKSSDVTSSIVSGIVLLLLISFAIFLFNIGLALWVGELLGKPYLGFIIVAAFYALVALALRVFRHSLIKEPVSTMIIKKMLN